MYNTNLIYHPDHQQALEHYKELLKKAEKDQPASSVMAASKRPLPSFKKLLQLVIQIQARHANKTAPVASRTPSAQP
jgi:hypothetical protein